MLDSGVDLKNSFLKKIYCRHDLSIQPIIFLENLKMPTKESFWTLLIQCKTVCESGIQIPKEVLLTDCGNFVSRNEIQIPISQNIDAKILVAKSKSRFLINVGKRLKSTIFRVRTGKV